ncbi:peroxidase family protein [Ilumatobacter sp.]|uniref:peroxidase family protein n=1 Tax=Ilumatobacter sp. TaxID=1967498 RepID=UPI003C3E61A4
MEAMKRGAARADGSALIEAGRFREALALLETAADDESMTGDDHATLALAFFLCEKYEQAADRYAAACATDASRVDWNDMRERAVANAHSELDVYVPDVHLFTDDDLLAPPPTPNIPARPAPLPPHGHWRRLRRFVGHEVGSIGGALMGAATNVIGKRYHDAVWTNWYRRSLYRGILSLAYMREHLMAENLIRTYPRGANVGFLADGLEPPDGVTHFRTADGSWNNLDDPKEGAAGTRFVRNVANSAIRPGDDADLMSPNPRTVSRVFLTREGPMKEVPFLNLLAASWIQFQNHDWINHADSLEHDLIEIPLDEDDPARQRYRQRNMFVGRTQPDPTRQPFGEETPATFINEVTHWWDGSQLYGSDQATQDRLRSGIGGTLRLNDDGTLPLGANGVEDTGMNRNWWVGLSMMHTLFAREHNAICERLAAAHPTWDDNRLFNVARLVNAAVMAKIHSVEWTPAILPNHALDLGLNANWYGMFTYMRKPENRRTVSEFNVENPELGGIVGNAINKYDAPFGLSEEFVEVYRLHSLLPEELHLRRHDTGESIEDLPVGLTRQAGSAKLTARIALVDLFFSFGTQHPGQLVLNNYPAFLQELSVPGNPLFDMGTIDVLRARERGVPRYNEFRRQLRLQPIRTFADLTDDADVIARLVDVYGDNVEHLDLMIGTLAEDSDTRRPTHFGFGETMFQIFILNASRRLQADRFFTDDYREEVYSAEGMQWVDDATLKNVLLRHIPELAGTGLANVTNAFEPWDDDVSLDPLRHPLRAYNTSLRPDPWLGDSRR